MVKQLILDKRAGYDILSWCRAIGLSRATYYILPPGLRPRSIKLGRRHIVIESPEDYLNRMAILQANDPQQDQDIATHVKSERG